MRHTMMDRWIEVAEARSVCERAMAEEVRPRVMALTPEPVALITKLRAAIMQSGSHRHSDLRPAA
jgi:hypothetical protein